jgi:hypothetical protein
MKGPSFWQAAALYLRAFGVAFDGVLIPCTQVRVLNYATEMAANDEGPASA